MDDSVKITKEADILTQKLINLLQENEIDREARLAILSGLNEITNPEKSETLVQAFATQLKYKDNDSLSPDMGHYITDEIQKLTNYNTVREEAARCIAYNPASPQAIPALIEALQQPDQNDKVKMQVVKTLGIICERHHEIDTQKVSATLFHIATQDKNPNVREYAATAWIKTQNTPEVTPVLIEIVKDNDKTPLDRACAAESLGNIAKSYPETQQYIIPALVIAADDDNKAVKNTAREVIKKVTNREPNEVIAEIQAKDVINGITNLTEQSLNSALPKAKYTGRIPG